ncbi:MAG TPA: hypothetical protein VNO26_12240 [Candidatus Limnocylindria bacterium]|nr:hypothetical protein [Candidatus Limnocylindria bacterium]
MARAQPVPLGPQFEVTSGVAFPGYSDVAIAPNGDFMVVWQEDNGIPSDNVLGRVFSALVNADTTAEAQRPSVAAHAGGGVVWDSYNQVTNDDSADIFAQRFDTSGPLGGEFLVNAFTQDQQDEPAVAAWPGGEFVVVWTAQNSYDYDHDGALGQVFEADSNAVGSEFQVYDAGYEVDVATHDQRFVVSFLSFDYDVGVRRFDRNAYTTGYQALPSAAAGADGTFVVTWTGQGPPRPGVFGRRFAIPDPRPVGVTAIELTVLDKLAAASKAKVAFVAKDETAGITKGAGTNVQDRRWHGPQARRTQRRASRLPLTRLRGAPAR